MKYMIIALEGVNRWIKVMAIVPLIGLIGSFVLMGSLAHATENFVDTVRLEGYITAEMYDDYLRQMSFDSVEISMVHTKKQLSSNDPQELFFRNDILEGVYGTRGVYTFEEGDRLHMLVEVKLFTIKVALERGGLILNEKYH